MQIYLNGTLDRTSSQITGSLTSGTTTLSIGSSVENGANENLLMGIVDEVRISNIDRSLSYIRTSYNQQSDPAAFFSVQAEETGPGPVGYWSFDEGYGTTAHDGSGQGNHGTITGAEWWDESECVSGKCLYFDGVEQTNLEAQTMANMNRFFTTCFWAKPTSLTNIDSENEIYLFDKGWAIRFNNSGLLDFFYSTSGTHPTVESSELLAVNQWTYICSVFNGVGNEPRVYLNGLDKSANADIGSGQMEDNSSGLLAIGSAINEYAGNYQGFLDEVKTYPYARTADQIKQDYAAGLAGVGSAKGVSASFGGVSDKWMTDGLAGYWKFDESAMTSGAIDSSGNGLHGMYIGDASTTAGKFGRGASFDGTGDYISISDGMERLTDNRSKWSMSVWL